MKVAALEQQILAEKSIQESIQQQYRQMLSDREESIREEVEDAIAEEVRSAAVPKSLYPPPSPSPEPSYSHSARHGQLESSRATKG